MTKNKKGKKNYTLIIIILAIVAVVAYVAISGAGKNTQVASSYTVVDVTRQDMETTVKGSGVVESQDKLDVYAPTNLGVEEVYVESGDEVEIGTPIAKIDKDMYLDAEKALEDSIDQIDASIDSMFTSEGDTYIYSSVEGTIKTVNVDDADSIAAIMNRDGYLFVVSADDNMKVELKVEDASTFTEGDQVTVEFDNEKVDATLTEIDEYESTIKVVFADDKYEVGLESEVFDEYGNKLGSGSLEINVPVYIEGDAGTVRYLYVEENSSVSKGTKLLRIQDNGASGDLISLTEQREDLQTQLDELREGVEEIGLGSDYVIYSTGEGIVDGLALTPNMTVADGMKMYTVQSTHPLMMYVAIDELDISSIEAGQQVDLKFEALPGETYKGEIAKINSLGQSVNGVTNYTIKVTIGETGSILIGMSGNVTIMTAEKQDVLTIPVEAVQLIDDEYYVILGADANIKTVADHKIETGINDGAYIEVIEGLADGDTIATPAEEGLDIEIGPNR